MFTKMNSKPGRCKQHQLFLRGAMVLAGSLAAFASSDRSPDANAIAELRVIYASAPEEKRPEDAEHFTSDDNFETGQSNWSGSEAEKAYNKLQKWHAIDGPYSIAKREYNELLEKTNRWLESEKSRETKHRLYKFVNDNKAAKKCGFQVPTKLLSLTMPGKYLGAENYTNMLQYLESKKYSVDGFHVQSTFLRNLDQTLEKELNQRKPRNQSRPKRTSPKRDEKRAKEYRQQLRQIEENKRKQRMVESEKAYNALKRDYDYYHENIGKCRAQLDEVNNFLDEFDPNTGKAKLVKDQYTWIFSSYERIVQWKKDSNYGFRPLMDMPELPPKDEFDAHAQCKNIRDIGNAASRLKYVLEDLKNHKKALDKMQSDILDYSEMLLKQKRKRKSEDDADDGMAGPERKSWNDYKPWTECRRLATTEYDSGSHVLIIILILILFLRCAFVVHRFKRRASVPGAKRLSLNAAETMV